LGHPLGLAGRYSLLFRTLAAQACTDVGEKSLMKAKDKPLAPKTSHNRRRKRPARQAPDTHVPGEPSGRAARAQRLCNRGAELLREGQAQEAISVLRRAYALLPGDVPTAINLGGAYILNKQYEDAISILERAQEQEPENEMIWVNLGAAYLGNPILAQDEQQLKAIAAFERALELRPGATNVHYVHYNLGLIHRDRGEREQAIRCFRQAVQVNPLDQHARRALRQLEEGQDAAREG
jgi:tetratricopeptide (TPR) repeat protein